MLTAPTALGTATHPHPGSTVEDDDCAIKREIFIIPIGKGGHERITKNYSRYLENKLKQKCLKTKTERDMRAAGRLQ